MNVHLAGSEHDRFTAARQTFDGVARTCADRLHVREIDLAGARVRLRFVGDALVAGLFESFAHLQVAPQPTLPALCIDAWAEDETGVTGLPPNFLPGDVREPPLDGGVLGISADEQYLGYGVGDNSVSWMDRRASYIVASVRRSGDIPLRERVKPFGPLLMSWLRDRGVRVTHAAAVGDNDRAVLLPGPSGSGKSTCATVCVAAGLRYLADDAVGLEERSDGRFIAHSLYGGARLWPLDGELFPDLSQHAMYPDSSGNDPKLLLFVGRRHMEQLLRSASISAIAFPRITMQVDTRLRTISRAEALRAFVASSLFLWMQPRPADIDQMLRLLSTVPVFSLDLGTDRSQIPHFVRQCLQTPTLPRHGDAR